MTPEEQPVLVRMTALVSQWEAAHDRRAVFLGCYRDRHSPWFDFVDRLLGPADEWLTSRLISHWREEVWNYTVRYLELTTPEEREVLRQHIEQQAVRLGTDMLKITL
jgi:hypothetical protein